jgi:hypothetical protein
MVKPLPWSLLLDHDSLHLKSPRRSGAMFQRTALDSIRRFRPSAPAGAALGQLATFKLPHDPGEPGSTRPSYPSPGVLPQVRHAEDGLLAHPQPPLLF